MRRPVAFALALAFLMTPPAFADGRDSDSRFGTLEFLHWDHGWNGHHNGGDKPERSVALMKEAGVGWIRMDFLWSDVEPSEGRWDFAKYDRLVDLLLKHDIKILGLLNYNAEWSGKDWNAAPDPAAFTRYAQAVVARYKDRVKYWEVWNEPDQAIYWVPQDGMKSYAELLKSVYPAIKAEDPTAVVLLGGLSGGAVGPLRQVYRLGGKEYFDVVNIHPFVNPLRPDALKELDRIYRAVKDVMMEHGDAAKPVWITEIGAPGVPHAGAAPNWWLGENPDEAEQAKWIEELYTATAEWHGLGKIFWAFFRDTPNHFLTGTDYFGLVREDFSKKPAFEAYRRLARKGKPS